MNKGLELYIHIPFCIKKCSYCDFVSFSCCEDQYDQYIGALCEEIRYFARAFSDRRIDSVYIGGGTPSVLSCDQITKLVKTLKTEFEIHHIREKRRGLFLQKRVRPSVEFSIEVNPGTADKEKISCYRQLGINRLSIGLQSADNHDLKTLGRIHTYEDFVQTFENARECGFDNINVDLMQAIPGQTLNAFKRVLAVVGTWKPEHISAYSLIIEDGTLFSRWKTEGKLQIPDEDTEREIYYYTREFLEKSGYYRYEISNYAVPGFECAHNIGYWKRKEYLGLGLNASSMAGNVRWKNTADLSQYLKYYLQDKTDEPYGLQEQEASRQTPEQENITAILKHGIHEEVEVLSHRDQMEEYVFLGLRLTEGISRKEFLDTFHQDFDYTFGEALHRLAAMKMIVSDGDNIRLTDRGVDVSNTVFAELLK